MPKNNKTHKRIFQKLETIVGKNAAVLTLARFLITYGILQLSRKILLLIANLSKKQTSEAAIKKLQEITNINPHINPVQHPALTPIADAFQPFWRQHRARHRQGHNHQANMPNRARPRPRFF